MIDYKVGDIVRTNCQSHLVRITEKKQDIKRGLPGYHGVTVNRLGKQTNPKDDGFLNGAWGYDSDVLEVVTLPPVSETERVLRDIIEVYRSKDQNGFCFLERLNTALSRASAHVHGLDACEFEWENGGRCNSEGQRTVRGLYCCEEHARRREGY